MLWKSHSIDLTMLKWYTILLITHRLGVFFAAPLVVDHQHLITNDWINAYAPPFDLPLSRCCGSLWIDS
jgi:hypothetical protein